MRRIERCARVLIACLAAVIALRVSPGFAQDAAEDGKKSAEERPKIGVVLGGGGALGLAHIGVLRVLEEREIPIDYIAGTSMGAIVAGLYAAGMSPDEMEALMCSVDWWDVMRDRTPRREAGFRRKDEEQRYLFDFELGLKGYSLALPNGLSAGQKLNNLMERSVINVANVQHFDDLNIPYRALATDIETGESVVLDRGSLPMAMRASMAVPGVFSPVEMDGRVLVDGGVVNNLPVDVIRKMGADVVIAVDVAGSDGDSDASDLGSFSAILGKTYAIIRRPEQERLFAMADVGIQPDLKEFGASKFHRAADIIPRGEAAARGHLDALSAYRSPKAFRQYLRKQRSDNKVRGHVSDVRVAGNDRVDERLIRGRIRTRPGDSVDLETIHRDIARIHGMGDLQNVGYRLQRGERDGGQILTFNVHEKPWGPAYLHFGLRLQSDFDKTATWDVLANYSRRQWNSLGGELNIDLRGGRTQAASGEFFQPTDYDGRFFIAPGVGYESKLQDLYENGEKTAEYQKDTGHGEFAGGVLFGNYAELRLGARYATVNARTRTGAEDLPDVGEDVAGLTCRLTIDRLDKVAFSRRGYLLRIRGFVADDVLGTDAEYEWMDAVWRGFHSVGDHTFSLKVAGGTSFGSELPDYDKFLVGGGAIGGLEVEELRGNYFGVAQLGYRYRLGNMPPALGQGIYALARFDAGNAWEDGDDIAENDLVFGSVLGLGADSRFGPVFIGAGIAEGGEKNFRFSVGTIF